MSRYSTIELNQNDLIFLNSPLNMLAKFVLFLQDRFSQGGLPWQFSHDENETDVFIHTEYNTPQETSNAYPRISVGRGSFVHQHKTVQGDLADPQPELMTRGITFHWSMCTADIQIMCVSENRGETSILGDIVQASIGMSRKEICKQFGLHELSTINFQATQKFKRDQDKWQTNIQFRIQFPHRWVTSDLAPTLDKISVSTKTVGDKDLEALEYVKNQVLRHPDLDN